MNQTNLLKRYLYIFSSYFINKNNKSKAIFYHDVHKMINIQICQPQ